MCFLDTDPCASTEAFRIKILEHRHEQLNLSLFPIAILNHAALLYPVEYGTSIRRIVTGEVWSKMTYGCREEL